MLAGDEDGNRIRAYPRVAGSPAPGLGQGAQVFRYGISGA
jgi:hypothetical protein